MKKILEIICLLIACFMGILIYAIIFAIIKIVAEYISFLLK